MKKEGHQTFRSTFQNMLVQKLSRRNTVVNVLGSRMSTYACWKNTSIYIEILLSYIFQATEQGTPSKDIHLNLGLEIALQWPHSL